MIRPHRIARSLIPFLFAIPFISSAAQFKVTRIYDGDTVKAIGHDIEIKVRLVGIDAPKTYKKKRECGQSYSQQAKKYLAGLVLTKIVDIKEKSGKKDVHKIITVPASSRLFYNFMDVPFLCALIPWILLC